MQQRTAGSKGNGHRRAIATAGSKSSLTGEASGKASQKQRKVSQQVVHHANTPLPSLPPTVLPGELTSPAAIDALHRAFNAATPFRHLHVRNVFPDVLLEAARDELLRATYFRKRNDLYDFAQTDDLRLVADGTAIAAVRDSIYSKQFRAWITAITGIETLPKVDASAALYDVGGHLLCHDDDLAARRIAYIVYLVPRQWDVRVDGGSLDLFNTTPDGRAPHRIVRRLEPVWNSLAFFDVSHVAHHQVRKRRRYWLLSNRSFVCVWHASCVFLCPA